MGLSVPQKNFDGLFVPDPYISSWVNHYSMFFSCLTQKNIYFLRMGGWPSLKTERRRQKWTSDMESVSSTAFGCVVVCATKQFGWIICSRSIYFILGQPLFNVF